MKNPFLALPLEIIVIRSIWSINKEHEVMVLKIWNLKKLDYKKYRVLGKLKGDVMIRWHGDAMRHVDLGFFDMPTLRIWVTCGTHQECHMEEEMSSYRMC